MQFQSHALEARQPHDYTRISLGPGTAESSVLLTIWILSLMTIHRSVPECTFLATISWGAKRCRQHVSGLDSSILPGAL